MLPLFVIILGWGHQPERLQAGLYIIFYTLTASLPLLIGLINIIETLGSIDYFIFVFGSIRGL
ncbi:hypothetical protein JQN64_24695 [Escherichia coli]|nr:hypothetical protein [Escherichia coli]